VKLFSTLTKVVWHLSLFDKISYPAVLSSDTVCYDVYDDSTFLVFEYNPEVRGLLLQLVFT